MRDITGIRALAVAFILSVSNGQLLTTKCPNDDWSHYLERCYLVVNFQHSWQTANDYCNKYGARLAEPTGYTISDEIGAYVSTTIGADVTYWIGYNTKYNFDQDASVGYWSDAEVTSVEVGVWGLGEPDLTSGECAYVDGGKGQWFMAPCDRIMPFVCEMDPCPTDTFMCNGRCVNSALVCNGIDDCGNGLDEQACSDSCTFTQTGDSGTVTLPTSGGRYANNVNCLWTLHTSPGKRINLIKFETDYFETEPDTDVLEVWDGGPTLSTSTLVDRLSGALPATFTVTSSHNYLLLRFVPDGDTALSGFQLKWSTEQSCTYQTLPGKIHTLTSIVYDTVTITSRLTTDECTKHCSRDSLCYGFSYIDTVDVKECRLVNALPVLQANDTSTFYVNTCPSTARFQASLPVFGPRLTAEASVQQLSTLRYPLTYPGIQQLEYFITAEGNYLITMEVTFIDLCCGDTVDIYDGTLQSHTLLEQLGSSSTHHIIVSTGPDVFIRMSLLSHWKCGGVLINFRKGCDIVMTGTGEFQSPGFGTSGSYPGVAACTWTLLAPSQDRSISLQFDNFDLEDGMDFLTISGSSENRSYTGTDLPTPPPSIAEIVVRLDTSAITSGAGFKASFSPGCPGLSAVGMEASIATSNYGDHVTVTCGHGYSFSGQYADSDSVSLTCALGGSWDIAVPVCTHGVCGPPPNVDKAVISTGTGTNGGQTVTYQCVHGYDMTGIDTIMCLASNDWTQPPICTSVQCNDVAMEADTVVPKIVYRNGTNEGSVAQLTCPQYHEIHGAATVQCSSGVWDYVTGAVPSTCKYVRCETPIIANAYLSPEPPYNMRQQLDVECKIGFTLVGDHNFLCGVTSELPTCAVVTCSTGIRDIANVTIEDTGEDVYSFGDVVNATCNSGYGHVGMATPKLSISCLANGTWSHIPSCKKVGCGTPQTVSGSVYEDYGCSDFGCQFSFMCKERFVQLGLSDQSDTTVRCGATYDGLWDFGDLRCTGGQCPDPGYPPSGRLVGNSFAEDATVTFECTIPGYTPYPDVSLTCVYNSDTGAMEWNGTTPSCKDTEPPTIPNCPDSSSVTIIKVEYLTSPSFLEPYAVDNNAISTWVVQPENYKSSMPAFTAQRIYYSATDYDTNKAICRFQIIIPRFLECKNDETTDIDVTETTTYSQQDLQANFMVVKDAGNTNVTYTPPSLTLHASADAARAIYAVRVDAYAIDTNELKETCTLQFRIKVATCASWTLDVPNGSLSCSGNNLNNACTVKCDDGYYFMEDPSAPFIDMECSLSTDETPVWNREPPICSLALTTDEYVIYTAMYQFKYLISDVVEDNAQCTEIYSKELDITIPQFIRTLETTCTGGFPNSITLVIADGSPTYYYDAIQTRLRVILELIIYLDDETVDNVLELKNQCASTIMSGFGDSGIRASIEHLTGSTTPVACGSGTYDLLNSGQPANEYDCKGFRKIYTTVSEQVCLDCPLGYSYDKTVDNCVACPAGRYGVIGVDGAQCVICPNSQNPGLTGRKSEAECNFADICPPGTFSKDGLRPCTECPKNFFNSQSTSRTCTACEEFQVTLQPGSTSSLNCIPNENVQVTAKDITPCQPSPCNNGGTCSIVYRDFRCNCPSGYTGIVCETPHNACSSNPCQNGQLCQADDNYPNGFQCECNRNSDSELSGDYCQIDDFGCASVLCNNNGTCHNELSNRRCMCAPYNGYTNDDGQCNTVLDPCVEYPCQEGTCIAHGQFYRSCHCYPGFTGTDCSGNIDDCDPDPCENGATCVDGMDSMVCVCPPGYHGHYCQFHAACSIACDVNVTTLCHTCNATNTDVCANVGDSYTCTCRTGYTGGSCEIPIDPCNSYPCQHGGSCNSTSDSTFVCQCSEPWTGELCENEANNCQEEITCLNRGHCFSTYTGTICDCLDGYIGQNCTAYNICGRVNPCSGTGSSCAYSNDQFDCTCGDGYTGDYCETPLPSCASGPCQNQGTCRAVNGEIRCSCAAGFTGKFCDEEIDRCQPNPCTENQECVNLPNGHNCRCVAGKRGASCTKDVGGNFDYVVVPTPMCRDEASTSTFGDGVTPIDVLTVSFHVRYTRFHDPGTILNIYGTHTGVDVVPEVPDFHLKFGYNQVDAKYTSPGQRRKRRNVETTVLEIPDAKYLNDGYWHDVTVTWSAISGEITLYVDREYAHQSAFSKGSVASRGFVVFGEFDTVTGTSVSSAGFEGRISRLYVLAKDLTMEDVQTLVTTNDVPVGTERLLHEERTTMLQYVVDFNSEVTAGVCVSPADTDCPGLFTVTDPVINSCPGDMAVVSTERESTPSIVQPVYPTGNTLVPNIESAVTLLGWGVHGVIFAVYDADANVAVCSYRLFNRPVPCRALQSSPSVACENIGDGLRCKAACTGMALPGDVPLYQTCSTYGMWDEDTKRYEYIPSTCSARTDTTYEVTLSLDVDVQPNCNTVKTNYENELLRQLNAFNGDWGNQLCGESCYSVLQDQFKCAGTSSGSLSITFPYVSSTLTNQQRTFDVADVIKIAVVDDDVFTWNDVVVPVYSSLNINVSPKCREGHMVSKDSCVQCGKGTFYSTNTGDCQRCAKGSYNSAVNEFVLSCNGCHQSQTTTGTGSTSGAQCFANCLNGQYYDIPEQQCRDCLQGFYNDMNGAVSCVPCPVGFTTVNKRSSNAANCVPTDSLTTTPPPAQTGTAAKGAVTEDTGISVGAIVAIVFGVVLVVAIILLVICFCCCKVQVPCFAKKTTEVVPEEKESYYVNKYGETHMRFSSYNLQDVRDKKTKPIRPPYDKMPIMEPLSDEGGSTNTDISIHVPIFLEKLDGSVTRKSTYISNGSARGPNTSSPRFPQYDQTHRDSRQDRSPRDSNYDRTPRDSHQGRPPRDTQYDRTPRNTLQYERDGAADNHDNMEPKKRRKKHRSRRKASQHMMPPDAATLPKALSPMPSRLRSSLPSDSNIRPTSAMNQKRVEVLPSDYREFVGQPSARSRSSNFMSSSFDDGRQAPTYNQRQIQVESDDEDLR